MILCPALRAQDLNQKIMTTFSASPDQTAIAEAMEKFYFQGIFNGDLDLLRQVFHPATLLFGDVNGQPYAKTLGQYLDGVASRVSPKHSEKPFEREIISIDIVNSIAVVKARIKMYDFNYHDFLSFHKIDKQWVIVNKMLTHVGS
jgi:hypothetical protein